MGVEVEEIIALAADKVVRGGWAAACNAYGLWVGEGGFEGFVVDRRYAVRTKTDSKEDEGWVDNRVRRFRGSDKTKCVFVNVRRVLRDVDLQSGSRVVFCELSGWRLASAFRIKQEDRETNFMQLAVAEGPNHWPGCLPQDEAPCCTNLWIEKGALGLSANRDTSLLSSWALLFVRRQSRPICSIIIAFASRL